MIQIDSAALDTRRFSVSFRELLAGGTGDPLDYGRLDAEGGRHRTRPIPLTLEEATVLVAGAESFDLQDGELIASDAPHWRDAERGTVEVRVLRRIGSFAMPLAFLRLAEESANRKATRRAELVAALKPCDAPEWLHGVDCQYLANLARLDAVAQTLESLAALPGGSPAFPVSTGFAGLVAPRDALHAGYARSVTDALIARADREFGAAGARLELNAEKERVGLPTLAGEFLPSRVWAVLSERHSGKGAAVCLGREARVLWKFFDLDRSNEIKMVGGSVELVKRIYTENMARWAGRSGRKVEYSTTADLFKFKQAWAVFVSWAFPDGGEQGEAAMAAGELVASYIDGTSQSPFQANDPAVGNGAMTVKLYAEKAKFRVAAALADRLQAFLGEFGPEQGAAS